MDEERRSWYKLSRAEVFLGILPATVAAGIALAFYSEESFVGAMAHSIVNILTLPGFLALELIRLIFQFGSLHGDGWDSLSIPLSAVLVIAVMRIVGKLLEIRRGFDESERQ